MCAAEAAILFVTLEVGDGPGGVAVLKRGEIVKNTCVRAINVSKWRVRYVWRDRCFANT